MGRWASKEIKFYLGSKSDNSISIALKVSFQEIYLKISIDKTHRIWYLYCCSAEKNLHCRSNKGEHRRIQSPIKHPRYSFLLKQLTALTDFATSFILDVWQGFQYNCAAQLPNSERFSKKFQRNYFQEHLPLNMQWQKRTTRQWCFVKILNYCIFQWCICIIRILYFLKKNTIYKTTTVYLKIWKKQKTKQKQNISFLEIEMRFC